MQSAVIGFVAVAILPLIYLGIPNPVLFAWYYKHPRTPVPPAVQRRVDRTNNVIPFVAVGLLFLSVLGLLRATPYGLRTLGFTAHSLLGAAPKGVAAGCGCLLLYAVVLVVVRPTAANLKDHLAMKWSIVPWLLLGIAAAIGEEMWRVFCLISLAGMGRYFAIAVTTLAFGVAHIPPLGRALGATAFGAFAAHLFVSTNVPWVPLFAHAVLNVGVFFLLRLSTRL